MEYTIIPLVPESLSVATTSTTCESTAVVSDNVLLYDTGLNMGAWLFTSVTVIVTVATEVLAGSPLSVARINNV